MKESKVITDFSKLDQTINPINNLVWKRKDGNEVKLMDMSKEELQKAYNHASDMLYNKNKYTPGRIECKKNIKKLINECNAELLRRFIIHDCNIDFLKTNFQLIELIKNRKSELHLSENDSVTTLFNSVPQEFSTVTLNELMDACFDKLDVINRKMISDDFILAQGIWLTESEKQELTEYDEEGKLRPWLDVIKERLIMNDVRMRVDPKGFSFAEFRLLLHLNPLSKISTIPTDTLRLLRDKVFILLDIDTDYHINRWTEILNGIKEVAKYKDFELVEKSY